ncbi:MAG: Fur family transcriptional regulator [Bacteroidota bacterium]|nr:Fur family transcriptional regulator [Bacteroidota bacterium]
MILEAEKYLIDNGINPSYQRIKIMEYLLKNRTHPTIDTIYLDLKQIMPKLSKTTIYNTLQQFIEKGITQIINIENNETRYDVDTSTHGHFKCENCGIIYDFDFDVEKLAATGIDDFEIHQTHVYLKGICSNCKNKLN